MEWKEAEARKMAIMSRALHVSRLAGEREREKET